MPKADMEDFKGKRPPSPPFSPASLSLLFSNPERGFALALKAGLGIGSFFKAEKISA